MIFFENSHSTTSAAGGAEGAIVGYTALQQAALFVMECLSGLRDMPDALVSDVTLADSSDDWLEMSPDELEKMLAERFGHQVDLAGESSETRSASQGQSDKSTVAPESRSSDTLRGIVQNMGKFLSHLSSFEGVEVPAELAGMQAEEDSGPAEDEDHDYDEEDEEFNEESIRESDQLSAAVDNCASATHGDAVSFEFDTFMDIMMPDHKPTESSAMVGDSLDDMARMLDAELSGTDVLRGFEQASDESGGPVDIDLNLVANLLKSYEGQEVKSLFCLFLFPCFLLLLFAPNCW